jgi:peptidoglycan/LPS O-acetylase OafA/YrhL
MRHNGGLDLIRVLAALSVFVVHFRAVAEMPVRGPVGDHGYVAVTVFFVLSGYLVYAPFVHGQVRVPAYLLRRILRIAPAAFFMYFFVCLFAARLRGGFAVYWSLWLEAGFYALLPIVAFALKARWQRAIALVAVSFLVDALALANGLSEAFPSLQLLPTVLWTFGLGMTVAAIEGEHPRLVRLPWLAPVGAAILTCGFVVGSNTMTDVLTALGTAFLVAVSAGYPFESTVAEYAAELSYPFYLWHGCVLLALASWGGPSWVLCATAMCATVAISAASVRYLERPIRRRAARFIKEHEENRAGLSSSAAPVHMAG